MCAMLHPRPPYGRMDPVTDQRAPQRYHRDPCPPERQRIAFLDVDGTILDDAGLISPATVAAIRVARGRGHLVFLSTGRAAVDVPAAVQRVGFDGVISNGGACATIGTETIVRRTMPREALDTLTGYFEERDILYFLQADEGVFTSSAARAALARPSREPGEDTGVVPRFRDLAEADREAIAKAVFLSEDDDAVTRARTDLGDAFHIIPGSMPLPSGSNGEVGMRGVTKGSAILAVLAHLNRPAADAIGIGDSWNDVEMFEVCGSGIAMGNADAELKAIADEVTEPIAHDGVARAFARHGLIPCG